MNTKKTSGLRTWIEINTQSVIHNLTELRKQLGNVKIMAVVKSNAYGHGLHEYSLFLQGTQKIDWLGVDSITEAHKLREEGIVLPILVLGYTLPEKISNALDQDISFTVSTIENLHACREISNIKNKKLKIHIKVDTGLHRQGFLLDQKDEVITFLKNNTNNFEIEGLYTHFAQAKDPHNTPYTHLQIKEFNLWIEAFKEAGFSPLIHATATAGALLYPEARYDMVRSGAGVYGIWPSEATKKQCEKNMTLMPVLSWKTIISETKSLKKGMSIGYDCSETLSRDSIVAVCPIGYWHGFPRSLSSNADVVVDGKRAKILGKVAMDMIVIDITNIPDAHVGSEIVLLGRSRTETISAEEMAYKAGTTSYEILTRLNPFIKKIYM